MVSRSLALLLFIGVIFLFSPQPADAQFAGHGFGSWMEKNTGGSADSAEGAEEMNDKAEMEGDHVILRRRADVVRISEWVGAKRALVDLNLR